jgi:hypothetical protein
MFKSQESPTRLTPTSKEALRSMIQRLSSTGCLYLLHTWKDKKNNEMVNVEVLMHGEVNDQYVKVDLIEAGHDCQKLAIAQALQAYWLSIGHFESLNEEETLDRANAQTDQTNEPQDKYGNFKRRV